MSWWRPTSLQGRMARFYALVMVGVLVAFAATVYAIVEAEEAKEPPEVAALEGPDDTGEHFLIALLAALPVGVAVAIGGAVLIARRGLAPLADTVTTTARISAESLHERIAERPDAADEVAAMVRAVNAMLERLELSVAGMRRFSADASHELRTPLGALAGELELALRRPRSADELRASIEIALEQAGSLSRLVEALLTLARSDASGLPIAPVELDLVALVRQAVDPYLAIAAARGVSVRWEMVEPALMKRTDPLWVGRVVANLIDNACKLVPDGGAITVSLTVDNGRCAIGVRDTGPGIANGDEERIFERFYRGATARAGAEGFGLGLPLAREIAHALGGELRLVGNDPGAHFAFEL
jgi:two-component system, OmpR family, sensor kinase